jgi:hypothetical protein
MSDVLLLTHNRDIVNQKGSIALNAAIKPRNTNKTEIKHYWFTYDKKNCSISMFAHIFSDIFSYKYTDKYLYLDLRFNDKPKKHDVYDANTQYIYSGYSDVRLTSESTQRNRGTVLLARGEYYINYMIDVTNITIEILNVNDVYRKNRYNRHHLRVQIFSQTLRIREDTIRVADCYGVKS